MKPAGNPFVRQLFGGIVIFSLSLASHQASAATRVKLDNPDDLFLGSSWFGGFVPGASDVASWDSTVTSANSTALGSNLSWGGIAVSNPAGNVTITGANTLTLGTSGIDMTSATANLEIASSLTLGAGNQVWNVASGRTLTLSTGTFSRTAGATLNIQGTGTVAASMTGIANTNGIIGAWATVGTGTNTRFATLSTGSLTSYTGATVMGTTGSAWGGIPSGGSGTVNYQITIAGTPGATGLGRNVNTLLYSGSGLTQGGNNTGLLLNANGIMNVGTGTFVIGASANQFGISSSSSANELVLAAANANITVNADIRNNGANSTSVVTTGTGSTNVTLVGNNGFTGNLFVNSGTLQAGTGQGSTPSTSNLGALQPASNRNIIINNGGVLSLTGGNVLGTGGSTNTLSNTTLVVNNGGLFRSGLDGSGAGWWNKIGATNLNGGTIRVGSGANTGAFQALALIGTVTVGGNSVSTIENFSSSNSASNSIHLGQNAGSNQSITFDVADVTGSAVSDLMVSAKLINTSSTLTASGLTKSGAGTMTLTGANGYTGATVVNAGTLQIGNGGTTGSLAGGSAITTNASLVFNRSDSLSQSNTINGTGSLTKMGAGTLTLTGALSHSGATGVSEGTLALTTSQSSIGALNLADSAGLSIKAASSSSTLLTTSSLTLGSAGTTNLTFDFSNLNTTAAQISTGAFTANGNINFVFSNGGVLASGSHPLIDYTSFAGSGSFPGGVFTLSPRSSGVIVNDVAGTALNLNVTMDVPKWTGLDSGNWQAGVTGASSNWKLVTGNTSTDFITEDNVLFDDSALGSTTIAIASANVSPVATAFNNSSLSYTVSGAFGIAGSGGLSKGGTAPLTLENVNSYSGGTTLNAGTLNINNGGALGSGTLTINGGTINNTSGSPVVSTTNNAQTWNGDFTFSGSNNLDLGLGTVTTTGVESRTVTVSAGTLAVGELKTAAGQGFVKQGMGTLVLASTGAGLSASVVNGVLDVATGTIQINRTDALSADSGDLTAAGFTGSGTIFNGAAVARWAFSNPASGTHTFSGSLANGGTGALGFNKSGAGTQILSGDNSYTDLTTVAGGELIINGANIGAGTNVALSSGKLTLGHIAALGTNSLITMSGNNTATLAIATDGGDNLYNINQGTGTHSNIISDRATPGVGINHTVTTVGATPVGGGSITFTSGSNVTSGIGRITFSTLNLGAGSVQTTLLNPTSANVSVGSVTKSLNNPAQTLELGGTTQSNEITGVISNGSAVVGLTKSNTSTWSLTGASTYTGATTVSGGTLFVNGSLGNTAVTVSAVTGTATLGGNAVIGSGTASLTVAANGVLAPGNSPGTVTVNGSTTLNSGSLYEFEYEGGGTNADLTDVNGLLAINPGASLSLVDLFNQYTEGDKFTLFAYDSLAGAFDSYADDTTYVFNGGEWFFNYNDSTPGLNGGSGTSYITITAVPEPSALVLGAVGALALLRRRRKF